MTLAGKVWNKLGPDERTLLLRAAYPNRAQGIIDIEKYKKWNQLLPSTQQDVQDVDFSITLGRDVQP